MKKILAIAIMALIFMVPAIEPALSYGFYDYSIAAYDVDIVVGSDNLYEITETITVDFDIPKHGIYREIPMKYEGQRVQIDNISVDEQYTRSKSGGNLILKIGDPDRTITGLKTYTIKYTFNMGRDKNDGYDLFYYNIIGTGWDAYKSNVTFSIRFPEFFDKNDVTMTYGEQGSTRTKGIYYEVVGLNLKGSIDLLYPGEGLTAHVMLPESAFAGESEDTDSVYFSAGAWVLCLLLIAFGFIIWNSKGRDPVMYPSVQFSPPYKMTPAEVGYVIDGVVDNKDITSLIFYWADKGYLDITESGKKEFLFIKKKEPETTNYFETYMFTRLFSYGKDGWVSTNDLKQEFYEDLPIIKTQIKEKFEKKTKLFTKESGRYSSLLHIASVIPSFILLVVILEGVPTIESLIPFAFMGFGVLFCGAVIIQTLKKWNIFTKGGKFARSIFFAVFILLMSVAFFVFAYAIEDSFSIFYHSRGFVFAEALRTALTTFAMYALSAATVKRTEYGHKTLEHLLGLKEFIKTAEMDKLKTLIDDDPDYFYNILPYAIVLGLEKKWAGKMDGITMPPPNYYSTSSGMSVSPSMVTVGLMRCVSRTGYVMTVGKPSSSGSGFSDGGGFSGGGAGGGGGGSW